MNTIKVYFLDASGTVTGSKFYLETPDNIVVECGMFKGQKNFGNSIGQRYPSMPLKSM